MQITEILIEKGLIQFLEKRQLVKQYQKAKKHILEGNYKQVDLKLRQPKNERVYYFRINRQFRAWCYIDWNSLKVFDIDNHQ